MYNLIWIQKHIKNLNGSEIEIFTDLWRKHFSKILLSLNITVCAFVSSSMPDNKVLVKPVFYLMVQLKFAPNSACQTLRAPP